MDFKLNVSKKGLSTTEEVITEEYTLHYGHIFRGKKGDTGEKGEKGDNGKSPKISNNGTWLVFSDELETYVDTGIKASGSDNNYTDADKALVQTIPSKVDKVDGKGLSTNDFTNEYKQKVDGFTIDMGLSSTSNNAIANSAVVQGLAGFAEGVSEAIGNVAKNVEQNTADIKTKQDTLTLTTKPNGNIVIGNLAGQSKEFMPATPSGDPMHYAYETEGAVYNNSDVSIEVVDWFGKTITHEPHKWYLNGLGDLSNKEMAKTYSLGRFSPSIQSPLGYGSNSYPNYATTVRTNIARLGMYNGIVSNSYFASTNYAIETINVSITSQTPQGNTTVNSSYAFNNCQKLRSVYGIIKLNGDALTTFDKCYKLQDIKISSLSVSVSFAQSSLLSKESLLYMINNCASNATFTITLHPDVYNLAKDFENGWGSEVEAAIDTAEGDKSTKITLASA